MNIEFIICKAENLSRCKDNSAQFIVYINSGYDYINIEHVSTLATKEDFQRRNVMLMIYVSYLPPSIC